MKDSAQRSVRSAKSLDAITNALRRERAEPCRWWYISFCEDRFLGAAIVQARGMAHAILRCHRLGINPGGEALGWPIPENQLPPPAEARDRLLSKTDLKRLYGEIERIDSLGRKVAEGPQ